MGHKKAAAQITILATLAFFSATTPILFLCGGYFLARTADNTYVNRHLASKTPSWRVAKPNISSADFQILVDSFARGFKFWEDQAYGLKFTFAGEAPNGASNRNDGYNYLLFASIPSADPKSKILAVTFLNGTDRAETSTGTLPDPLIRDFDIIFNIEAQEVFSAYLPILTAHEVGHVLGLRHSLIESSLMFYLKPLKGNPQFDDLAWASIEYRDGVSANSSSTGSISGKIFDSRSKRGYPGIHVVAINTTYPVELDGEYVKSGQAVSAYSGPDGKFTIPNLQPGEYVVYAHDVPADMLQSNISPLLSYAQISALGQTDFYFPPDFYDGNGSECNIEDSITMERAARLPVKAGENVPDIFLVSNETSNSTDERVCAGNIDSLNEDGGGCAISRFPASDRGLSGLLLGIILVGLFGARRRVS